MSGLRGANVRVEQRLDGTLAVRYGEKYLPVTQCAPAEKKGAGAEAGKASCQPRGAATGIKNFDLKKAPKVWQAAQESGRRRARRTEVDCRMPAIRGSGAKAKFALYRETLRTTGR